MDDNSNWPYIVALFPGLVALFIAIWHKWLESLLFNPKLIIVFDKNSPDIALIPTDYHFEDKTIKDVEVYWFRFRVKNDSKVTTAKNVEVYVKQIEEKQKDGEYILRKWSMPLNLTWSHTGGKIYFESIPPQMERPCDLGHIIPPMKWPEIGSRIPGSKVIGPVTLFTIGYKTIPKRQESYRLEPHTYKFHLLVTASNVRRPKPYEVILDFDGTWSGEKEDMLKSCVSVEFKK